MAEVFTTQDLIFQLLSQLLGGGPIPGTEQFATPLTKLISSVTGIGSDRLGAPLWSDMTPYGVSRYKLNEFANKIGSGISNDATVGAKKQMYRGLARTFVSQKAWLKENKGIDLDKPGVVATKDDIDEYNAYLDRQVADMKSNAFYGFLYNAIDPLDARQSAQYMSQAASNLIRSGVGRGNGKAYVQTQALLKGLFQNAQGEYEYDKRSFGHLTQSDVSALTAALTKDTDLSDLVGSDAGLDTGELSAATNRFRGMVQKYARALGPLKDIFGKDLPGMLRSIEELSGQTLAQMSPERAQQIAMRVADSVATGKYSMSEVSEINSTVNSVYSKMDVPAITRLMAANTSLSILDSINGGLRPDTMSATDFANKVADSRIRQSASANTRYTAMAYALWKQKPGNEKATFEDFKNAAAEAGYDENPMTAYKRLVGVTSLQGLAGGMAYREYAQAMASGDAAAMNEQATLTRNMVSARVSLQRNATLRTEITDDTARGRAIQAALTLAKSDAKVLRGDLSDEERATIYRNAGIAEGDYANVTRVLTTIAQSPGYEGLMTALYSNTNSRRQQESVSRARRMRDAISALNTDISSSGKTFLAELIASGGDFDRVTQQSIKYRQAAELLRGDEGKTLALVSSASSLLAKETMPGNKPEQQNARESLAAQMLDYGVSAEGLLNEGFQREIEAFGKAKTPAERLEYAKMAHVYMSLGNDAVEAYLGPKNKPGVRADRRRRLLAQTDAEARLNILHNTTFADQLDTMSESAKTLFRSGGALAKFSNIGTLSTDAFSEMSKAIEQARTDPKANKNALDEVVSHMNQIVGKVESADPSMGGVLDRLTKAIQDLLSFLNGGKVPQPGQDTTGTGTKQPGQR